MTLRRTFCLHSCDSSDDMQGPTVTLHTPSPSMVDIPLPSEDELAGYLLVNPAAATATMLSPDVTMATTTATTTADVSAAAGQFLAATAAQIVANEVVVPVVAAAAFLLQQQQEYHQEQNAAASAANNKVDSNNNDSNNEQPLLRLMKECAIRLPADHSNVDDLETMTLPDLDRFLQALSSCIMEEKNNLGYAPGFYVQHDGRDWKQPGTSQQSLPYQTLSLDPFFSKHQRTTKLPVPSPAAVFEAYQAVRTILLDRIAFLKLPKRCNNSSSVEQYCSCISHWDHHNSITMIINQALEQMMTEEASDSLVKKYSASYGADFDQSYEPKNGENTGAAATSMSSSLSYHPHIPLSLLADRDTYISAFAKAALACTKSIQIMTCYLFTDDPAQKYVLFDLLPYVARTNGVKVQILIDLLPMESAAMKSVLVEPSSSDSKKKGSGLKRASALSSANITSTSFVERLPVNAPPVSSSGKSFASAADCMQALLNNDSLSVQFWCARDAQLEYRIKNHAKCAIFDGTAVIMGGSNLTPTVKSATADLDVFLASSVVTKSVTETFETFWNAMNVDDNNDSNNSNQSPADEEKKTDDGDDTVIAATTTNTGCCNSSSTALLELAHSYADDPDCEVAVIRSTPSSAGEDVIFRVILEQIRAAQEEVLVAMGHSCFPKAFAHAVKEAVDRGVTVKILVNSLFSNDLRTGQYDLFQSLAYVLEVAPTVQVYATIKHTLTDGTFVLPEFLHGKYVVVDHQWSAVGSWNLWTRAAFHEIEHEAFIRSQIIADLLTAKFHRDQTAHSVLLSRQDCLYNNNNSSPPGFCPKGCCLCQGFGPFFMP